MRSVERNFKRLPNSEIEVYVTEAKRKQIK